MTSKRQFVGSFRIMRGLEMYREHGALRPKSVSEAFHTVEDEVERESALWTIMRFDSLFEDHIIRLAGNTHQALEEGRVHIDFQPILRDLLEKTGDAMKAFSNAIQSSPQLLIATAEYARHVPQDVLRDRALSDVVVAKTIMDWHEGLEMLPRNIPSGHVFARDHVRDDLFATLAMTRPRYSYSPLPTATSIRTVTISSNVPHDDLHTAILELTTHVVDLNDHPGYTTLSYTWGNPLTVFPTAQARDYPASNSYTILCDGAVLQVGENLYRYLQQWRDNLWHRQNDSLQLTGDLQRLEKQAIPQFHWIDALCINQPNITERNQQVAMMGRIYRQSEGVVIWLGTQDGYCEPFNRIIHNMAERDPHNPEVAAGMERPWEEMNFEERVRMLGLPEPGAWDWVCVWAVLRRAWFRRNWVVQELALAPEAVVIYGSRLITWGTLATLGWLLSGSPLAKEVEDWVMDDLGAPGLRLDGFDEQNLPQVRNVEMHMDERSLYMDQSYGTARMTHFLDILEAARHIASISPEPDQLVSLFIHGRHFMSSEPRDKVYSLLELTRRPSSSTGKEDPRRRDPQVRYEDDISQVYLEAAWYILLSGDNLHYLAQAGCWDHDSESIKTVAIGLPSWVQALDIVPNGRSLHEAARIYGTGWRAAGEHKWEAPETSVLYQRFLTVQGAKIDRICAVASEADRIVDALDLISHLPAMYSWTEQHVIQVLWFVKTCLNRNPTDPNNIRVGGVFASFVRWLCEGRHCPTCAAEDAQCQTAFRRLEENLNGILRGRPLRWFRESPWREYASPETTPLSCGVIRPNFNLDEVFAHWRGSDWNFACHRVFRTEKGLIGMGLSGLEVGDLVFVVAGSIVPFVMRPQVNSRFAYVSEAYVHGIMHGEALGWEDFTFRVIEIE